MATYTIMNSGVHGCTSQTGWYDIISFSECDIAAQALGLSDTSASQDGQSGGVSYDPPFCYFEQGSLKFNIYGANSGSCTNNDQCLCTNQYNAGASLPPPSPSPPPPPSPSPPWGGSIPPPPSPSPPWGSSEEEFEFPMYMLGPIISITWLVFFLACAKRRARQQNMSTFAAARSFTQRRRIQNGLAQMQGGMSMAGGASMMPTPQPQMATPIGQPMATPGVAAVPMAMAVPAGQAPVVVDATPMGVVGGVALPDGQQGGMSGGVVEEIEKLHAMKVKGILTEAQFQAAKDKVLQQPAAGATSTTVTTTTTTTMDGGRYF